MLIELYNYDNLIRDLQNSNLMVRFIETGAGLPTSNLIFDVAGASKFVYSSESYYAKTAFEKQFGTSKHRFVSAERLKKIFLNEDVVTEELLFKEKDFKNNLYNAIFASSFQVGEFDNKISTHGWICISIFGKSTRYFHISLHNNAYRKDHIRKIGEIGLKLLHAQNDFIPENCEVDIVLDDNLNPMIKEALEFISKCKDSISLFVRGDIKRLEDITRECEKVIVYKGSFNPPSIAHQTIAFLALDRNPGSKIVFCLSFDTYDKGLQDIESFIKRIFYLNKMDIPVLVMNQPLFNDTIRLLRLKFDKKIIFIQGMDTFNRMIASTNSIHQLESFSWVSLNISFMVFGRGDEQFNEDISALSEKGIVEKVDFNMNISSTEIRECIKNKDIERLKGLVPMFIYQDIVDSMD